LTKRGKLVNPVLREEIPVLAKIVAVTDTFNAMTTDRPYRKAMEKETAIEGRGDFLERNLMRK
jgi:hypothetical protein